MLIKVITMVWLHTGQGLILSKVTTTIELLLMENYLVRLDLALLMRMETRIICLITQTMIICVLQSKFKLLIMFTYHRIQEAKILSIKIIKG